MQTNEIYPMVPTKIFPTTPDRSKMQKKQAVLLKRTAPATTADGGAAIAPTNATCCNSADSADNRRQKQGAIGEGECPTPRFHNQGEKCGKGKETSHAVDSWKKAADPDQPRTASPEGTPRRRRRRAGPPKHLRSHEETDGGETSVVNTPAPSPPQSPLPVDAQGDVVMKDAHKPPVRSNEEVLSPTGLPHHDNRGWMNELLPPGICKKVEWITLNLLHKLQDRNCTR